MDLKDIEKRHKSTLREHWKSTVVFTDAWFYGANEHQLTQKELLPGELSASTFAVGCYTVRSAQRVYKVHETGYSPDLETPANEEDLLLVKKDIDCDQSSTVSFQSWWNKLRITHEISAKHNANPNDVFTYICRAAEARNSSWSEGIRTICTVKEDNSFSDECASLLVLKTYTGSSFGVDYWYKFDPDMVITTLVLHPYNSDIENARFN